MQVTEQKSADGLSATDVLVLYEFEGDVTADDPRLPPSLTAAVRAAADRGELRGQLYDPALFHGGDGSATVLVMGAGKRDDADGIRLMRLSAAASRTALARGFARLAYADPAALSPAVWAQSTVEGAIRGSYDDGIKKTAERHRIDLESVTLISDRSGTEDGARIGQIVGECTSIARDLVNTPPNELTPRELALRAQALAVEAGLDCELLDEVRMAELGMGSLLGVSAGSEQPAQLIVMRYGDGNATTKLALVGKGLTFDSGGLSLKTAEGMETMKGDMGGAAAVIAGMLAVARLAPPDISVTGYVGATENMPGGAAMKPGDVLTALNGKTIEVLNTDAEGRLVLADVLAYAESQGATHIVDFATLTGGAVVALGHICTLAAGRPTEWVEKVVGAAQEGFERAWAMPLFEEYRQAMDSYVADIKNTGGRYGSALTATAFLGDFVDGANWTHMDIAGTAWADKPTPYCPAGGTGEGVGTIAALVGMLSRDQA